MAKTLTNVTTNDTLSGSVYFFSASGTWWWWCVNVNVNVCVCMRACMRVWVHEWVCVRLCECFYSCAACVGRGLSFSSSCMITHDYNVHLCCRCCVALNRAFFSLFFSSCAYVRVVVLVHEIFILLDLHTSYDPVTNTILSQGSHGSLMAIDVTTGGKVHFTLCPSFARPHTLPLT